MTSKVRLRGQKRNKQVTLKQAAAGATNKVSVAVTMAGLFTSTQGRKWLCNERIALAPSMVTLMIDSVKNGSQFVEFYKAWRKHVDNRRNSAAGLFVLASTSSIVSDSDVTNTLQLLGLGTQAVTNIVVIGIVAFYLITGADAYIFPAFVASFGAEALKELFNIIGTCVAEESLSIIEAAKSAAALVNIGCAIGSLLWSAPKILWGSVASLAIGAIVEVCEGLTSYKASLSPAPS